MYWMRDHPVQIGSPGHVVQIDESVVSAPKRTRNRRSRLGRQIFGGIDQETKEAFLVEVPPERCCYTATNYTAAHIAR